MSPLRLSTTRNEQTAEDRALHADAESVWRAPRSTAFWKDPDPGAPWDHRRPWESNEEGTGQPLTPEKWRRELRLRKPTAAARHQLRRQR